MTGIGIALPWASVQPRLGGGAVVFTPGTKNGLERLLGALKRIGKKLLKVDMEVGSDGEMAKTETD